MSERIKSSENSVFFAMLLKSGSKQLTAFRKEGKRDINFDRMVWKFGFITAEMKYTSNDIQIILIHHVVSAGQGGG